MVALFQCLKELLSLGSDLIPYLLFNKTLGLRSDVGRVSVPSNQIFPSEEVYSLSVERDTSGTRVYHPRIVLLPHSLGSGNLKELFRHNKTSIPSPNH